MRFKTLIPVLLVIITGTTSIAQPNPLYKYIQPGSRMLMSFNLLKIAAKVPGETFRSSSLYQDMLKDDNGEIRKFLTDPSSTGIDFSTDFLLSAGPASAENDSPLLIGRLADQGKFAAMMEKMNQSSDDRILVVGNNRILLPKSIGPAIAWNDEVFVITGLSSGKKEMAAVFADTSDTRDIEERMTEVTNRLISGLKEHCIAALTPKATGSPLTSPVFSSLMSESGDIKIWNNGETQTNTDALKKLPPFVTRFLTNLQTASGSEKTSVINFEKGMIAGTTHTYLSPEMGAIYQKYPQEVLPTGLVRRLPEGKILMLMMTAVNKEMARELSLKNGMTEMLDSLKQYLKVDLSLIQKGFRNNGLFAVIEFPSKEEATEGRKNILENLGIFIVLPVADKAAVAQLKELADRKLDSLAGTEKGEKVMSMFRPVIHYNDSLCVITLSQAQADAYLNNPGTAALPAWLPADQKGSMWMNLNFREIMMMIVNMAGNPGKGNSKQAMDMFSVFDQMIVNGSDYANGRLSSRMEFRFSNPDKNVMEQLFNMINQLYNEKAQSKKEAGMPPAIMHEKGENDASIEAPPARKKAPAKKPATKTKGKN